MLEFYKRLIHLRKNTPALAALDKNSLEVSVAGDRILLLRRWRERRQVLCVMSFNKEDALLQVDVPPGTWKKILDSADEEWGGPGATLPASMRPGEQLTVRPNNLALFELKT